jgi:uncharacterized protein YkwD
VSRFSETPPPPERHRSHRHRSRRKRRSLIVSVAAIATAVTGTLVTAAVGAQSETGCSVDYRVASQWPGGYVAFVDVTNFGDPVSSWDLDWGLADGQDVRQAWNATVTTVDGQAATRNVSYNGSVGTGDTVSFGVLGSWQASNPVPSTFTFNGVTCNEDGDAPPPTVPPTETATPTATIPAPSVTTPSPSGTTVTPTATSVSPSPSTTAPAPTATTPTATSTTSPGLTAYEQQVLDLVNAERAANGCKALVIDPSLQKASHDYAVEMVQTHNFSHTSVDGLSPTDRAKAAGYDDGVGENIAMGYSNDPKGVVSGWMNSAGHRANILNCSYTKTGVGYDPGLITQGYASGSWVQDFGF